MPQQERRARVLPGAIALVAGLAPLWSLVACEPTAPAGTVNVFAAASLRDVMDEIGAAYAAERGTGDRARFNFAGSNVLAQQILAARRADVFVSADEAWMDRVEEAGRVIDGTRTDILENRIVVVANRSVDWRVERPQDLVSLPFRRLALADPEAVPAGRYAKAFLKGVLVGDRSLWERLGEKIVPAADVRAALALVEVEPSMAGIVYRTDATASTKVRVVYEVRESPAVRVRYVAARIERPGAPAAAAGFFDFLFSATSREIFSAAGFMPVTRGTEPR